jgi:hypothetical protein
VDVSHSRAVLSSLPVKHGLAVRAEGHGINSVLMLQGWSVGKQRAASSFQAPPRLDQPVLGRYAQAVKSAPRKAELSKRARWAERTGLGSEGAPDPLSRSFGLVVARFSQLCLTIRR